METVKIASQTQMLTGSNPALGSSFQSGETVLGREEDDWDED